MKWIVIIILVGAAAWGGWWYWKKPGEQVPEYRTATVGRGDIIQAVTASGQLNPVLNVQVGSQISGMIESPDEMRNSADDLVEIDGSSWWRGFAKQPKPEEDAKLGKNDGCRRATK